MVHVRIVHWSAHLASPGTPARSRRRPRPRHRDRRPEPRRSPRRSAPATGCWSPLSSRKAARRVSQAVQEHDGPPCSSRRDPAGSRRSWRRLIDPSLWRRAAVLELYPPPGAAAPAPRGSWTDRRVLGRPGRRRPGHGRRRRTNVPGRRPARRGRGRRLLLAPWPPETVPESTRRMGGSCGACRPRRPGERQAPAATALEDARPRQPGIRSRAPASSPPAPRVASRWRPRPHLDRRWSRTGPPGTGADGKVSSSGIPDHDLPGGRDELITIVGAARLTCPPHRVRGRSAGQHRSRSVRRVGPAAGGRAYQVPDAGGR